MDIKFEWDTNKAVQNLQNHKISFEEATTIFKDILSITVPDPDHSAEEDRDITIGLSSRFRLLMVSHTERGDNIRIISVRELTTKERGEYEEESWTGK